jgi:dienelactone hydrolase
MPLADYTPEPFTFDGKTRDVYRRGTGPAVIVIAEVPGITPTVMAFADRVVDLGCTAVLPHVFGKPGEPPSVRNEISRLAWACISREFTTFATGRTSPVTVWLRGLARHEHQQRGGPGVGVVGMCLTGGFALAMMADESVVAPVLSQPSLPFPVSRRRKRALDIRETDLAAARQRASQGVEVLGLRFTCDVAVPSQRFERLREELGDAFIAVEIDSCKDNAHGFPKRAHSVLTEHLVDEPGNPTRAALDQVLDLFQRKLLKPETEG